MLFVLYCRDADGAAATRQANRADHLAWAAEQPCIRMAGPMFAEDGETMIGSLFVVEFEDREAVEQWRSADPYVRAVLFDRVAVHPFRWALGTGPAGTA